MKLRSWPMIPAWVIMLVISGSMIYPVLFVVFSALKSNEDYIRDPFGVPTQPTFEMLIEVWNRGGLGQSMMLSLGVTIVSVLIVAVGASLAGWALGALSFPGRGLTKATIIMLMLLSPTVLIVPIFTVTKTLGLINNPLGLALIYASLHLPFATYLIASYAQSVPSALVEAAQVDGASPVRVFWSIGFPLLRPGVLTVSTLCFLWIWNELLFGLIILQKQELRTVQVAVATLQGRLGTPVPELAAGMLFSMLLPLLVFIVFQRNIAEGLVAGSLK